VCGVMVARFAGHHLPEVRGVTAVRLWGLGNRAAAAAAGKRIEISVEWTLIAIRMADGCFEGKFMK